MPLWNGERDATAELLNKYNKSNYREGMGNPFLLQACLRLKEIPRPLVIRKEYHFSKEGHRLYQLNVPMDLRTNDWKFVARVIITEFTVGKNRTKGTFIVVKEFSNEEKEIISKTYVSDEEVKKIIKGKK